jgi:hypothetical protein
MQFVSIFTNFYQFDFVTENTDHYKLKVRILQLQMPVKYVAYFAW